MCMTVDCIHYPITEPRPFDSAYSSTKLGKNAGLLYEFAIYTHEDQLASINWKPAGTNDVTIFRSKLKKMIEDKQEANP